MSEKDIKDMIQKQELYFNHSGDKTSDNKYSARIKLDKIDIKELPKYLINNKQKFKQWLKIIDQYKMINLNYFRPKNQKKSILLNQGKIQKRKSKNLKFY